MTEKIKIGVDIRDLRISKTGARTYLEEICREFSKEDTGFEFVFFDTEIPVYNGRNKLLKLTEHLRFFFWKQCRLPFKAMLQNCDIVFCTDYFVPYFHPGFITIPVFHDAFFWEYPRHYNKYWLYLFHVFGIGAAKRSPFIITPTKYTQKRIAQFSGLPEEKILPVYEAAKPLSVRTGHNHILNSEMEAKLSFPYILHVGTFEKRKNLGILITAFEELLQNGHPDLKLILIGQASPKKDIDDSIQLLQQINDNHLQEKVIMPGYISDELLHYYYKYALLYVFPSRNEGFGIPVLEAFAYGLPVLIANNSCLPEIAGDAAISFDPDDAKELSGKINELLTNKNLRQQLIEKATQRLQFFSWGKTSEELKNIFRAAFQIKHSK